MTYLNAVTRTQGYQTTDREAPKGRQCKHGFVPAEQYVRKSCLTASLQLLSIQHALEAPVWRRQHSLDECMIAMMLLIKLRPKQPTMVRVHLSTNTQEVG
jgi:hypothetical protein